MSESAPATPTSTKSELIEISESFRLSFRRFAVRQDPCFARESPLPDRVLNEGPEAIFHYECAVAEKRYREQAESWETRSMVAPPKLTKGPYPVSSSCATGSAQAGKYYLEVRHDAMIAWALREHLVTHMHILLAAIADLALNSNLRGAEALKEFDAKAAQFCRENFTPKWRRGLRRLKLSSEFDADFIASQEAEVSSIREAFEEIVWAIELSGSYDSRPATIATGLSSLEPRTQLWARAKTAGIARKDVVNAAFPDVDVERALGRLKKWISGAAYPDGKDGDFKIRKAIAAFLERVSNR